MKLSSSMHSFIIYLFILFLVNSFFFKFSLLILLIRKYYTPYWIFLYFFLGIHSFFFHHFFQAFFILLILWPLQTFCLFYFFLLFVNNIIFFLTASHFSYFSINDYLSSIILPFFSPTLFFFVLFSFSRLMIRIFPSLFYRTILYNCSFFLSIHSSSFRYSSALRITDV